MAPVSPGSNSMLCPLRPTAAEPADGCVTLVTYRAPGADASAAIDRGRPARAETLIGSALRSLVRTVVGARALLALVGVLRLLLRPDRQRVLPRSVDGPRRLSVHDQRLPRIGVVQGHPTVVHPEPRLWPPPNRTLSGDWASHARASMPGSCHAPSLYPCNRTGSIGPTAADGTRGSASRHRWTRGPGSSRWKHDDGTVVGRLLEHRVRAVRGDVERLAADDHQAPRRSIEHHRPRACSRDGPLVSRWEIDRVIAGLRPIREVGAHVLPLDDVHDPVGSDGHPSGLVEPGGRLALEPARLEVDRISDVQRAGEPRSSKARVPPPSPRSAPAGTLAEALARDGSTGSTVVTLLLALMNTIEPDWRTSGASPYRSSCRPGSPPC